MKAIAKPKHADDVQFYDLVNIINFSYWQVYGELFLEEFDDSIHREANKGEQTTLSENIFLFCFRMKNLGAANWLGKHKFRNNCRRSSDPKNFQPFGSFHAAL